MYIVRLNFSKDLLESYAAVTDWLYDQTFSQFYAPGNEVPKMSPLVEEAFSDKRFAKLKMTPHTFQCYLGLWRAININPPKEVHFPLPPLARIIPLLVSYWNVLKGGGDTITKLDDICQERIGIRSEVLVASARTLLNIGVVFHRCIQICSSKRLS